MNVVCFEISTTSDSSGAATSVSFKYLKGQPPDKVFVGTVIL